MSLISLLYALIWYLYAYYFSNFRIWSEIIWSLWRRFLSFWAPKNYFRKVYLIKIFKYVHGVLSIMHMFHNFPSYTIIKYLSRPIRLFFVIQFRTYTFIKDYTFIWYLRVLKQLVGVPLWVMVNSSARGITDLVLFFSVNLQVVSLKGLVSSSRH